MSTLEETNQSWRTICTMHYFCRVAMDGCPRKLTSRSEKKPITPNQLDQAPRWRCRVGYFSSGVDRLYRQKTRWRATSGRGAALCDSPRIFTRWHFLTQADGDQGRRNSWAAIMLQQIRLCFLPAGVDLSIGERTDHGEAIRPRATPAVSPWLFLRRS